MVPEERGVRLKRYESVVDRRSQGWEHGRGNAGSSDVMARRRARGERELIGGMIS